MLSFLKKSASGPTEKLKKTTYQGLALYYPEKSLIGKFVAEGQGWDTVLVPIMKRLLPTKTAVIAEVGANIGASLLQMQLAKPQAHFYCFEPSERFLPILEKNIASNKWTNVVVEPLIMGSKDENKILYSNASTASLVAKEYDYHEFISKQKVKTITLDSYFTRISKQPDFIKVDTDGFDYDVLLGADELLSQKNKPVIFFEFEKTLIKKAGREPRDVLSYLKKKGYTDFLVFSNLGEALEVASNIDIVMKLSNQQRYLDIVACSERGEELNSLKNIIRDKHMLKT